ncbi:MAG: ABC transporter permease [Eubacterium sp.]|nr:ABC transporter permease [Eubacterium sp.]
MNINTLPIKNLKRKSGRSAALIVVVMLLSLSMLGGLLVVDSLQQGLDSLETRLGADIIVVPDEAKSKKDLESILLDGVPGYFYMDKAYYDKIAAREGIGRISAQYYLASTKAGCCTVPVQIIGFDPETDFTVTPWIQKSGGRELGLHDVVAGYNINKAVSGKIQFFGVECTVVSKLDKTGTELDNAVYANYDTIKDLIEASKSNSFPFFSQQNPDNIVSSVLIDVADGYEIEDVVADINIHVRGVEATATKSMLSGVSDSLQGISNIIKLLIGVIWGLLLVILVVVFSSTVNERKKEFAVLRVAGMSRGMLAKTVLTESALVSLIGGAIGVVLSVVMIYPFSTIIENELGLPFLTPQLPQMLVMAAVTLLLTLCAGSLASAYEAVQLSKVDTGLILREGN